MCGICGILDFSGRLDLESCIRRMAETLAHRGPDDGATLIFPPAGESGARLAFGHRRLAIIDLSPAGRQPMIGRSDRIGVVLNGEIYNFLQMRTDCPDYPFRSRSDTELILALYDRYGADFVAHLDGMFAFALWDGEQGRLYLARDRAGKKPLFYHRASGFLAFASEIKALLALREVTSGLDPSALPLYLTFGYVPTPATFYSGIRKLEPATVLTVDGSGAAESRAFWRYPLESPEDRAGSSGDPEVELRLRMREAVARRLISDVPLGAFLSGGIDSSIIVGIMSQLSREPVRTFSIGFEDDPTFDETSYARITATRFGTKHTEFRVRARAMDLLQKLVYHYDEPFGDSSAIPTHIVSGLAREHVTVALSGDGGDELFAGYERFAAAMWAERLPRGLLAFGGLLAKLIPAPAHMKSRRRRAKRFLAKAVLPLHDRYLEWNSFFTRAEIASMLGGPLKVDVAGSFDQLLEEARGCTLLQRLLYLNYRTYLLDDLLVKTDRMSMAHGLEVRCPFLDTRLVEWAAGLPDHLRIRRNVLKYILKKAFRDLLPEEIRKRGKMGFGIPLGQWFRHELRDYSRDLLTGPSARVRSLINPQFTERLVDDHTREIQDNGNRIWSLLTLEVWLRAADQAAAAGRPSAGANLCGEVPSGYTAEKRSATDA